MGIIPRGESPWGRAPTIRFEMAADAINVSETTYLTAVLYYLANLGTTMESQVRSSVLPPTYLSVAIYFPDPSPFSAPRCVPRPSLPFPMNLRRDQLDSVAARQSRTRILAVTSDLTSYQIPDD